MNLTIRLMIKTMNKNKNKPLKITVIGGSGFVGTNLCKALEKSIHEFEIIDLKLSKKFPDKCKIGDIRDLKSLRKTISGEVVINLAAVHRDDIKEISEYQMTNVNGAKNLTIVCKEKNIQKIIFTSTVAVYGFTDPGTDETGKINPFNDYGRTKFEAEELLRIWHLEKGNSLIIVRPTVIFGEGNRGNVFNLINQIASGKFLMIGNGENKKSMAYIDNVVAFLENCIVANKKYAVFNYVDTPDLCMEEFVIIVRKFLKKKDGVGLRLPFWQGMIIAYFADFAAKVIGKNLPISSIRMRKFISSTEFQSAKLSLDNFAPPYSLIEGLERTLISDFINPDPVQEIFYTE